MRVFFIILLFLCIIFSVVVYNRNRRYEKKMRKLGFEKVGILFKDGLYSKGFITIAQLRLIEEGGNRIERVVLKPLWYRKEEVNIKVSEIFYIERL